MASAAADVQFVSTPRQAHVAHAWLRQMPHALLLGEAEKRGMHPDALVAKIVEVVMIEDWTATLLDP